MSIRIHCPEGHTVIVAESKVGSEVACPHCLAIFLADAGFDVARQARRKKEKARPAHDDDDDDEDEKPAKKAKPAKAKKDDEKPAKKAKPDKAKKDDEKATKKAKPDKGKKNDDDDEEEEDEDAKDEPEPEAPIEWTPRKHQLNVCSFGLMVMQIGYYIMIAFTVFTLLSIGYYELLEDFKKDEWRSGGAWYLFYCMALPLLYLAVAAFMACMVLSFFAVPAKAEAGAGLLATLVFGGLIFLLAVLLILTVTNVIVDEEKKELQANMLSLLGGGSMLCFVICVMSTMGYLSRLFVFMKMHLEATQPITNGAFVLMVYVGLLIIVKLVSAEVKGFIGDWMGIIIAILVGGLAGYGIFLLVSHAKLIQLLRSRIAAYIRDE